MEVATRHRVEVRFLGCFSLTVDGEPVRQWRAGKARNLFQYLVLNRGRLVTRDQLYEALWPEAAWSGGSSLKVAAHALRRVLGASPDAPGASGISIVYRDFGYVLHVEDLWSDMEEFQHLVTQGLRAQQQGHTAAALAALQDALGVYQGDFLAGEPASWAVEQREYLKSVAMRALDVLRDEAVGRDDFDALIDVCRRTLRIDRCHEETYRVLMAAHGRRGEPERARNWYDLCSRRLQEELAVTPDRETDRMFRTIVPRAGLAPAALARNGRH